MSALAHPLDIAVATDAELFDNNKWELAQYIKKICHAIVLMQLSDFQWNTYVLIYNLNI